MARKVVPRLAREPKTWIGNQWIISCGQFVQYRPAAVLYRADCEPFKEPSDSSCGDTVSSYKASCLKKLIFIPIIKASEF